MPPAGRPESLQAGAGVTAGAALCRQLSDPPSFSGAGNSPGRAAGRNAEHDAENAERRAPLLNSVASATASSAGAAAELYREAPGGLPEDELCGGIDIEWRNLTCFVSEHEPDPPGRFARCRRDSAKWGGCRNRWGPPTKEVMHGASGFALRGEILAVMGPSGSGKTTLLNVLAQRPTLGKRGYWSGQLLLNGGEPWENWEREMAYVMQKDIFYEELKVKENLRTTALLRLPHEWPRERKLDRLKKVMADLGLQDVAKTRIGTAIERGLSGGEVKRTSIANEMLGMPRLFFLDEPLTGLDSTRAVDVMRMLRHVASCRGTTVMLTIHQPSSALYQCFDRLLLLGKGGRTAYFGGVMEAVDHFSQIGLPLPRLWAPADHYIELLSQEALREQVCDAWQLASQPAGPRATPKPERLALMAPLQYQIEVLLPRQFLRTRRSYLTGMTFNLQFGLALIWGCIYFQVGKGLPQKLTDYVGAIFFMVSHWSWCPLFQGLGNFPKEQEVLTKEKASKVYSIAGYFVAQVVAEAPLLLVLPVLFFAIVWPLAGMPWQVLPQVFLVICLNIQVCSAMSMLISVICMKDEGAGVATATVVMVAEMCCGGYFADLRKLPWYIGWVRFCSTYYYTFGSILRLAVEVPFGEELHTQAIARYSFSDHGYFTEILALLAMCMVFRLAAFVVLCVTKELRFK